MEELSNRYKQLIRAYKILKYTASQYKSALENPSPRRAANDDYEEDLAVAYRDSLIKRFELCYELTWKFFKVLLRDRFSVEVANPRSTFQECSKQSILNPQEAEILLQMIRSRNETVHIYFNEELAATMGNKVLEYNTYFEQLQKKLAVIMQEIKYV